MLDKVDDYGFDFMGRYHYPVDEVDNDGFKTIHRGYIEYSNRIMSKGKIHGMYHDIHGFNREGISKDTGTFLNQYNFDRNGYWWKKDENGELVNTYSYVSDDGWTIDKKRIVNIDGKEIYTNLDERGFSIDHYYRPSPSANTFTHNLGLSVLVFHFFVSNTDFSILLDFLLFSFCLQR